MGKQLEEYSNTDTNTQFKYTHADRALTESIKEQIGETGDKVKDIMKDKVDDNVSLLNLFFDENFFGKEALLLGFHPMSTNKPLNGHRLGFLRSLKY